tara:strand:- start:403 stop:759 length:357 start_codon:yes stop_codon:yes gene_type:complete
MVMKKEFKNWRRFLIEKEKKTHYRYEAHCYLSIDQSKPIDRTEVMNEIRAIPEVTTVYREREISTSKSRFVGEYIIRFLLSVNINADNYYTKQLKHRMRQINGVQIQRDLGFKRMDVE